ncbi:unnamed protein product, partial [Ectocarpus sp. 12 AP-2014]
RETKARTYIPFLGNRYDVLNLCVLDENKSGHRVSSAFARSKGRRFNCDGCISPCTPISRSSKDLFTIICAAGVSMHCCCKLGDGTSSQGTQKKAHVVDGQHRRTCTTDIAHEIMISH